MVDISIHKLDQIYVLLWQANALQHAIRPHIAAAHVNVRPFVEGKNSLCDWRVSAWALSGRSDLSALRHQHTGSAHAAANARSVLDTLHTYVKAVAWQVRRMRWYPCVLRHHETTHSVHRERHEKTRCTHHQPPMKIKA